MAKLSSIENYICTLQKCRTNKDVKVTSRIYMHICEDGCESHDVLGNHLIPTLVECESFCIAQDVFDRLPHPNEVSWTSLIQGYVELGEPTHGFSLYERMRAHLVCPSKFTFLVMLKAAIKLHCTERGRDIHSEVVKNGLDGNSFIGNTLVDMYAKCGSLIESQRVFDELLDRDLVSWNALITGYADSGFAEDALSCFERVQSDGLRPDVTTFLSILKACTSIHAIEWGMEVHARILEEAADEDVFLGNTLVDMYAKCGLHKEASDVFWELPSRDLVSWNALITGHAEQEHYDEVFRLWRDMQTGGVAPNTGTCVRILQACSVLGEPDKGRELHADAVHRGFEHEFYVGSTLVDMYSKCGLLEDARNVFGGNSARDVALWNALIAGYSGQELEREAQNILWEMHCEGIPPDPVTYSTILKACSSTGAIENGREIHSLILAKHLQDLYVGSSLVDLYAKCGFLQESRHVFDKLSERDVVCWNALISGYADNGLNEEALGCVEQMRCEGIMLDPGTYTCGLQACVGLSTISKARALHADIVKDEYEGIPSVSGALVNMYVKNGFLVEACDIFDEQTSHDVISWTALIAGYSEDGDHEEVFVSLRRMQTEGVAPNMVTFVSALKAFKAEYMDEGHKLHALIVKMGLEREFLIVSSLMVMYAEGGRFEEAREMLEKLAVQDLVSWTVLISDCVEHGRYKEVLSCVEQLQKDGFSAEASTYKYGLQAASGLQALDMGQALYSETVKKGLDQDLHIGNSLLELYFKCGSITEAYAMFDRLRTRDLVSWTLLIAGYAEHGHLKEALECFHKMQLDGVVPDVVAWNAIVLGCAEHNECAKALQLCAQMQEQGLLPDRALYLNIVNVCRVSLAMEGGKRAHVQAAKLSSMDSSKLLAFEAALVDMYSKCGSLHDAEEVFKMMPVRDLRAWNALLIGYALQGKSHRAFLLFDRMTEVGVHPDEDSFLSIFIVCSHAGLLLESQHYHQLMGGSFGFASTIKHHTCLVDLLARAGRLEDAGLVVERMPFQPDLVLFHAMLSACRVSGNVEVGQGIFELAKDLDRRDAAAAFILMCNIYADCI